MSDEQGDRSPRTAKTGPRRLGAVRIGKVAGVPIYVNASWFIIAALIAWLFAPVVESEAPGLGTLLTYAAAFVFAILLYASVLVHEISHVLMARRYGIPIGGITLQFLGGMSEIEEEPSSPWREFSIAVVGPLTSLAIGGASWLLFELVDDGQQSLLRLAVLQLAWANVLVGLFNLLPGLPLDGGRMLRAIVWGVGKRPHLATQVAAWVGRVVALGVVAAPWLILGGGERPSLAIMLWSLIIATFLWFGSTQALLSARVRKKLPALRARDLARRGVPVDAQTSVGQAIERARQGQAGSLLVVDRDRRPVSIVNESAALAIPEHRRPWVAISDVARRIEPGLLLNANLSGEALVRAMGGTPSSEYLLVEPGGEVYGVLATADVDHAFSRA